jgi:hypothetical protein
MGIDWRCEVGLQRRDWALVDYEASTGGASHTKGGFSGVCMSGVPQMGSRSHKQFSFVICFGDLEIRPPTEALHLGLLLSYNTNSDKRLLYLYDCTRQMVSPCSELDSF